MTEFEVTYDQAQFSREKDTVDWGVLISEGQGSATVCVVALTPAQAITLLAGAIEAIGDAAGRAIRVSL